MNYKRACCRFALPVSLVLACAACGQNNQGQPYPNTPAPAHTVMNPSVQTPQPHSQTMRNPGRRDQPATGTTSPQPTRVGPANFDALAGSDGVVSLGDAQGNEWMTIHFTQCDSNGDGEVTRSEYEACRNQQGGSMMQQPASSRS